MKLLYRFLIFTFAVILTYFVLFHGEPPLPNFIQSNFHRESNTKNLYIVSSEDAPVEKLRRDVVLSAVACGDRVQETLTMIKSAAVFSQESHLKVVVIAEPDIIPDFREKLNEWTTVMNGSFSFETHPVSFPKASEYEWRKLFKPCAAQRLFLPSLLPHIDSVLYADTDVLFLSPPENVWKHFDAMNSSQLAALTPEHEDPNTGWYNRFAQHPYYGKLGVNSGVMLMNLTRMREFKWEEYLLPILKQYKLKMTWGDQDIINIIFHFHPERLYVYDCTYNFRSDHCMYRSVCKQAENQGIRVLHGSRGTFHTARQPAFKAVFQAFQEYQLGTDIYQYLLLPMESYLKATLTSNCGKIYSAFLKQVKEYVGDRDYFS